jgi:hypothetical protein
MAPICKSALKRGDAAPKPKPKRQVLFGRRTRTFRVPSSDYPAKKPTHGYIMSGSQIPRRWPEKTEEEKAEAIRKAREVATDVAEDEDVAMACLSLLYYKYRQNSHYLHTYFNETSREARREDATGDWRSPPVTPCPSDTDVDSDNEMPGEVPPEGWDRVEALRAKV